MFTIQASILFGKVNNISQFLILSKDLNQYA